MHIVLKDPRTGEETAIACVERKAQAGIILYADADKLGTITAMVKALKVPDVLIVVPASRVDELLDLGWERSDQVVLCKP